MNGTSEQLARRNRELEILGEIAAELNRPVDLDRSLQVTLAQTARLLDLRTGWIILFGGETGEPWLAASQNLPSALADHPAWRKGSCRFLERYHAGAAGEGAMAGMPLCDCLQELAGPIGDIRYHASIPLRSHDRELGVLTVAGNGPRELSAEDLRALRTIGDLLSVAVERARLFDGRTQLGAVEERNRLAREIHDTLAQGLTAISLRLEMADALLESGADIAQAREAVGTALDLARYNLEEARRSVLDLRAAPLQGRTLAGALEALAVAWHAPGNPEVTLDLKNSGRRLPPGVEIGLYRIAQEALNNIASHAGARHVRLRLETGPEYIRLVVEDDGAGFEPYTAIRGRHGIIGMNERANLLGGWLRVHSIPGEGTRLEVSLPTANLRES